MLNLGKPTKEQWVEIITVTIKTIGVLALFYLLAEFTGLVNIVG